MKKATLAIAFLAAASMTVSAQRGRKPVNLTELPAPFATPSVRNNPTVVPRPEGATLTAPPGFVVEEFMDFAGMRPRFMMLGPGNEILISDTSGNGSVFVIKDGVRTAIIEKLDRPYGLALKGDQLYVAEPTSIKVYTYDAKTLKVTSPGKEIISLAGMGTGHNTRTLAFNRDGSKLYLSVGSQSNIDLGEDPMRAAVHRYNPDGTGHETIATGLRNAVGMRFYPGTDDLWVTVHERDALGDDLAPDYATKVEMGGFYGWPIAYIGPHVEPRHKDVDMKKVESTLYPDVILGGHVGPLDLAFYTGKMFPARYQGGMFVALHGSWNRSQRQGYKIAFIPFKNRMATAGPEDFVSGWMLAPDKKEVWGRPVGLLQMPDGSLLVSDDGGRKVWRISYKG
ncbi:MAG TPA: PQQ-dependent sugar dehydrogenase [Vicinamibacterales bacterium]|nr:PQQ-dependent sugar dehydrogenase [Vicinamibacterales bacterium]